MKKITLINILWFKEKKHWKRTGQIFKKFDSFLGRYTFGVLIAILGIVVHYAFALMHTFYELLLFIFARRVFKVNLQRMVVKL